MFPVLFAIGRLPGWIAQWKEMIADPTRASAAPARSTPAPPSAATSRSTSADPPLRPAYSALSIVVHHRTRHRHRERREAELLLEHPDHRGHAIPFRPAAPGQVGG
jgi:hypothetical protein